MDTFYRRHLKRLSGLFRQEFPMETFVECARLLRRLDRLTRHFYLLIQLQISKTQLFSV